MKKLILIVSIIVFSNVYSKSFFETNFESNKKIEGTKCEECIDECLHLIPSTSRDLQNSDFRACYRRCMGTLY